MASSSYMTLERIPYRLEEGPVVLASYDPREPLDAQRLHDAIDESREHLSRFAVWPQNHRCLADTVAWIRAARARFEAMTDFNYGLYARDDGRMVGGAGLHVRGEPQPIWLEIGYWTRSSELRRGWATTAARALTRAALELAQTQRVVIRADTENGASRATPEKLGFHFEGVARRGLRAHDEARDAAIYSRIASDG
jgi:ribosomal-protein-serine acetyltransferase